MGVIDGKKVYACVCVCVFVCVFVCVYVCVKEERGRGREMTNLILVMRKTCVCCPISSFLTQASENETKLETEIQSFCFSECFLVRSKIISIVVINSVFSNL